VEIPIVALAAANVGFLQLSGVSCSAAIPLHSTPC
jgi:hypothetical protein